MAREYVKKDNMLSKEIRYKKTEKGMMITEYYGNDSYVVLPDEIEGEPVTILAEIFQLRKYGCRWNLKKLEDMHFTGAGI